MGEHDSTVAVRLPADLKSALQLEADRIGVSVSELIRVKLLVTTGKLRMEPALKVNNAVIPLSDIFRPEVISEAFVDATTRQELSPPPAAPDMSQSEFARVVRISRDEAIRLRCQLIDTSHLLLGILALRKGAAIRALKNLGVAPGELKKEIEEKVRIPGGSAASGNMPLTDQAEKVLKGSREELAGAQQNSWETLGAEHLLLAILRSKSLPSKILARHGVTHKKVKAELAKGR